MISNTPIAKYFEPNLIAELESVGKIIQLPAGTTIMRIGQEVSIVPLVITGNIKVSRVNDIGNEILLYYVNAQESCAMTLTCCMQHIPSEIEAIAEDEVTLLAIPITMMDTLINKYPSWKQFVMRTMHSRFNELLKAIDHIAFENLDDRLIHYLKEKAKVAQSTLLNITHEQIAIDLASNRVVISRLLKKLETQNKLLLYRNQIKLLKEM